MKKVLLGLGSNSDFGELSSLDILKRACHELALYLKNPVYSSVYVTKAMYVDNQNDFFNMVVLGNIADEITPVELLRFVNEIEAKYGRDRSKEIRFGPRSLDIDIELFGDEAVRSVELEIPHPRLSERAFVLIPALEILDENADKKIIERFQKYLSAIDLNDKANRVDKYIPSKDFL